MFAHNTGWTAVPLPVMDWVININNVEEEFVQFNDALEHIKQHLSQWNNFEDITQAQIIVVYRKPNDTPSFGIHSGETVETHDVFGGLPDKPDHVPQEQWDAAVQAHLRNKRQ